MTRHSLLLALVILTKGTAVAEQTTDFNIKAYLPVLATAYGEAADQDYGTKVEVLSTILNRAESGRAEFGADTGRITDVLQRGYYAYSKQSPKFMEAMEGKFPDKMSEDSFKEFAAIFSGMMKGKIKKTEALFFLTPSEINRARKTGSMNMDLLEETVKSGAWSFFKYKDNPKGRKKGK